MLVNSFLFSAKPSSDELLSESWCRYLTFDVRKILRSKRERVLFLSSSLSLGQPRSNFVLEQRELRSLVRDLHSRATLRLDTAVRSSFLD